MEDLKQQARDALERVIGEAGSQVELAKRLAEHTGRPIATGHVHYWLSSGSVPTDICVALESMYPSARRQELRPEDFWRHWPDLEQPKRVKRAAKAEV